MEDSAVTVSFHGKMNTQKFPKENISEKKLIVYLLLCKRKYSKLCFFKRSA